MSGNDLKNTSGTNWEALESMSDDDIDYSDIPPLTDEFFEKAILRIPAAQAHMIIRKFTKDDAEDYRKIRLKALNNNPDSFGTTYHEEAIKTIAQFRERIPVDNNNFILGCYEDKELIGIVVFHQEERIKVRHKAYIRSMYVQQQYRGKGIGKLLLNKCIEIAKDIKEIEILLLDVVSNNTSAKQLYLSLGFKIYGIEKMAYKFNNQYFDMEYMSLQIR